MEWYLIVLKKYAVFEGRARRAEYWMFTMFNILVSIGIVLLEMGVLLGILGINTAGIFNLIYTFAVLLPGLSVLVRRLHDTGRSGWYFFISLIPIIGSFVLLYFLIQDSAPGENQYGPNPKAKA